MLLILVFNLKSYNIISFKNIVLYMLILELSRQTEVIINSIYLIFCYFLYSEVYDEYNFHS
jgi:hypothetical protein